MRLRRFLMRQFFPTLIFVLLFCGLGVRAQLVAGEWFGVVLAQAEAAQLPSNVKKVGRLYVLESVVVGALFGGAIYAVCRTSRRT